jgi:hypothetical protein
VLHTVKEERGILHTIKQRKANWIGHILSRNCLLEHMIEGKLERAARRGRTLKQLLNDSKETREYWKFKEKALDCSLRTTCLEGSIRLVSSSILAMLLLKKV